jgi:formylglycine-generating enzyme required for sulfatase activity/predicted Ser/Thr protein kinase
MIGQTPQNRYQVTTTLGKGAMGVVYRALDQQTQREVALKVISSDLAPQADILTRFRREGEALQALRHRNIVAFVDMFAVQGHQVIVMEYVPGGNLHQLIRQGPLPLARAREIALDLCDALTSAHRLNIIHRDIKPENVLLAEDGTPKLTDFGLARLVSAKTRLTGSSIMLGTPDYMSPEAWEGRPLDAQGDIWSLGVMLYEMLAGELPFICDTIASLMHKVLTAPAPDIRTIRPQVPPALAEVVGRMLRRDLAERYRTMRQVAVDLEAVELPAGLSGSLGRTEAEESGRLTAVKMVPEALPVVPPPSEPVSAAMAPAPPQPFEDLSAGTLKPLEAGGAAPVTPPQEAAAEEHERKGLLAGPIWPWAALAALIVLLLLVGLLSWRSIAGLLVASPRPTPIVAVVTSAAVAPRPVMPTEIPSRTPTLWPTPVPTSAPPTATSTRSPTLKPPPAAAAVPSAAAASAPGVGSSTVWAKENMRAFYVPAGQFLMGSTPADIVRAQQQCPSCDLSILQRELPRHAVYLDAFWIDQTDVTNAMFAKFVQSKGYKTDAENGDLKVGFYDPQAGKWLSKPGTDWQHPQGPGSSLQGLSNYPVVQVSYADAQAYCNWAGRHLPTEAQWEKAARGTDGYIYSWGNGPAAGNLLNFADKKLNIAGAEPTIDDGYQLTSPVGVYPKGASPYGALDMAGNVAQWVADWYDPTTYAGPAARNPTGPATGQWRLLRGGSWYSPAAYARATTRITNDPARVSSNVGFRCAAAAP